MRRHHLGRPSRPFREPLCAAFLGACGLGVLAAPDLARAFDVFRHGAMTSQVLGRAGVPGLSLAIIVHGATWPDFGDCLGSGYCPEWVPLPSADPEEIQNILSAHHFDNSRLQEGVDYVNTQVYGASGALQNAQLNSFGEVVDYTKALFHFGQGLHALQDFYAHSTWIECQTPLLRIGGNVANVAIWDGNPGNGCAATVQGIDLAGLQTGYFGLPTPGDGISHDLLNKDNPGSPQGSVQIFRLFPSVLIGNYYQIVTGDFGSGYEDRGVAPRHTVRALDAIRFGVAVFNAAPPPAQSWESKLSLPADVIGVMQAAEANPTFQMVVAEVQALNAQYDGEDPNTYPGDEFDADGFPLSILNAAGVEAPARELGLSLAAPFPNPFNPRVSVAMEVPAAMATEPAVVVVHDLRGRIVTSLHHGPLGAGRRLMVWNGADASGARVASGSYRITLRCAGLTRTVSATLIE